MDKNFYITTTLAYVNADLHIGHAAEFIRADILARYKKMKGFDVVLNTGTDEHGQKIFNTAEKQGMEVQEFVDKQIVRFKNQIQKMNIDYTNLIRTTDENHKKSAQEFWRICEENGDIYKKTYKVKYCVGCELEKTDSELVDGECPLHPGKKIEGIEEENYFFRFSNYEEKLLKLYEDNPDFVIPDFRQNEIKKFVERGLQDFSISRLREKMPWGIPVPGDDDHVMYVWFDALINYISTIGWPEDTEKFEKNWPVFQVCGKDNLRQQSAMWQAMLMSAGLDSSKQIHVFGFINSGGQKMSKSIGNVINPLDIVNEYGTDALRYYVVNHINMYEDSDMTMDKFKNVYNADLANGLGNLTSRILKMASNYEVSMSEDDYLKDSEIISSNKKIEEFMDSFEINKAGEYVWSKMRNLDLFIEKEKPFKKIKEDEKGAKRDVLFLVKGLYEISILLKPFLPDTAGKINKMIKGGESEILFERK